MSEGSEQSVRCLLVRHAFPTIDPERPAAEWALSDKGKEASRHLAPLLKPYGPSVVLVSPERKARETGEAIAAELDLDLEEVDDLREQGNEHLPWMQPDEFRATVHHHFEAFDEPVLVKEAARDAGSRVAAVIRAHAADRAPVLVTHGRAMTAAVHLLVGEEPGAFWSQLTMPDVHLLDIEHASITRVQQPNEGEER